MSALSPEQPLRALWQRHRAYRGRFVLAVTMSTINKIAEGSPHVVDWIERGDVHLVINTPTGSGARADGQEIRRAAIHAVRRW